MEQTHIENLPILKQMRTQRKKDFYMSKLRGFLIICALAAGYNELTGLFQKKEEPPKEVPLIQKCKKWGINELRTVLSMLTGLWIAKTLKRRDKYIMNWAQMNSGLPTRLATDIYAPLTRQDMENFAALCNLSNIKSDEQKAFLLNGIVDWSKKHPSFAKLVRSVTMPIEVYSHLTGKQNAGGLAHPYPDHAQIDIPLESSLENERIRAFSHELKHAVQYEQGLYYPNPDKKIRTFASIVIEAEAAAYDAVYSLFNPPSYININMEKIIQPIENTLKQEHPNASSYQIRGMAEEKLAGCAMQILCMNTLNDFNEVTNQFCTEHNITDRNNSETAFNLIHNAKVSWKLYYPTESIYDVPCLSDEELEQYNTYYKQQTGYPLNIKKIYEEFKIKKYHSDMHEQHTR